MDHQNIRNTVINFLNNYRLELEHFDNAHIHKCYAYMILNNYMNDLELNMEQANYRSLVIQISNQRITELNNEINRFNQIINNNNYWTELYNRLHNFIREIRIIMGLFLINQAMINVPNEIINNMLDQVQNNNFH